MGVYSDPNATHGVNSAVIIDRSGEFLGLYHKQWPCCGGGSNDGFPGRDGTRVFDLDFGRIAVMTCASDLTRDLGRAVPGRCC